MLKLKLSGRESDVSSFQLNIRHFLCPQSKQRKNSNIRFCYCAAPPTRSVQQRFLFELRDL